MHSVTDANITLQDRPRNMCYGLNYHVNDRGCKIQPFSEKMKKDVERWGYKPFILDEVNEDA